MLLITPLHLFHDCQINLLYCPLIHLEDFVFIFVYLNIWQSFFFFFGDGVVVLEFEVRASCLLGRRVPLEPLCQSRAIL